jgi:hypothetical protein
MIAFFCVYAVLMADSALENHAILQVKRLMNATEQYVTNRANKVRRYPSTLADLVKPPFGGTSFLQNKEKDLHDPWGMLYRQAFEVDDRGLVRQYVWTEREVNGKVKRIGYPPKGKKE